jgi:hypothetical protein
MVTNTGWDRSQAMRASFPPEPKRSNTALAVVLTVLGMLVSTGVVGACIWLYLRDPQGVIIGKNSTNAYRNFNVPGRNTNGKTTPTASPSPNTNSTTSPTPAADNEEIKRDVTKAIMTWKSMTESRDLDSYMGNYADTVDYYRTKGASRAFVRRDKQRAFTMFDSIDIDITNVNVTPGPAGDEATVEFDKEWVFDGDHRSTGKVRQQMRLKNVRGDWLITAERDLKVYYTN